LIIVFSPAICDHIFTKQQIQRNIDIAKLHHNPVFVLRFSTMDARTSPFRVLVQSFAQC
jgi:hypothetical protein